MADHNSEFSMLADASSVIAASTRRAHEKRAVWGAMKLFCTDQRQLLSVFLHIVGLVGGLAWRREVARRATVVWARAFFRVPFSKRLKQIVPDSGHCFRAPGPRRPISDQEGVSTLMLLEDDSPLAAPHTAHDMIRRLGRGGYSHWGECIYFSSSDNTDPRTNGRIYKLVKRA